MLPPKAHLREANLQWGQNQRGLAQAGYYLHILEFGDNLKVNKSSFVEIVDMLRVFYIVILLAKSPVKISQNFPSCTGVVCVKSLLSEA